MLQLSSTAGACTSPTRSTGAGTTSSTPSCARGCCAIDCDPTAAWRSTPTSTSTSPLPPRRPGARTRDAATGRRLHDGDLPMIVVAHVGGLPVEETVAQLAPLGIVVLFVARERTRRLKARLRGAMRSEPASAIGRGGPGHRPRHRGGDGGQLCRCRGTEPAARSDGHVAHGSAHGARSRVVVLRGLQREEPRAGTRAPHCDRLLPVAGATARARRDRPPRRAGARLKALQAAQAGEGSRAAGRAGRDRARLLLPDRLCRCRAQGQRAQRAQQLPRGPRSGRRGRRERRRPRGVCARGRQAGSCVRRHELRRDRRRRIGRDLRLAGR